MNLKLFFYQYELGNAFKKNSPSELLKICFNDEIVNSDGIFIKQIRKVLSNPETPDLLRKHIQKGLYLMLTDSDILLKKLDCYFEYKGEDIPLNDVIRNESYYYFYITKHPFSQWHKCKFTVDGMEFNSAEQYMMYGKAMLFNDIETAEKILESSDVREQKSLGRGVRNFDLNTWEKHAIDIVYKGNYAKFTQNEAFYELLLSTKGNTLVEASSTDIVWGVGYEEKDTAIQSIFNWKGTNWLGIVLTELRENILAHK